MLQNPKHPFVAILGGAKVSDKILLIESLLDKADKIIVAVGWPPSFGPGGHTGKSLVEKNKLELAIELLSKAGRLKAH